VLVRALPAVPEGDRWRPRTRTTHGLHAVGLASKRGNPNAATPAICPIDRGAKGQ
jgi:hypothetical protein